MIELDAEEEVDLGSAWRRIAARWWLPLAGLVLGAALGVLVSVGGGEVYRAETLIYLGQPFTPQGGGQIQTLQTNPRTVSQIIRSQTALKKAAADSDLRVGQLRGNVSSQAIVQVGQARSVSPLVEISVEAPAPRKAERAADALATVVIRQTSSYVDRKIELLERQNALAEQELERVDARLTTAQDELQRILRDESIPLTELLLVSTNLNSTIGFAEQRRATVQQQLYSNQQLLSLARNVEKSDIVQHASASRETAPSRRNAAAIGGLIGLLLGALAAFIADPILARRNAARES